MGYKRKFLMQHLNTHKQQLRALSLQIIIHYTHVPVHRQIHRLTGATGVVIMMTMREGVVTRTSNTRANCLCA